MSSKSDFVKGLRDLADFIESASPEVAKRKKLTIEIVNYDECQIPNVAKALGSCEKFVNRDTIGLKKRFGPVTLKMSWWRSIVCKKVQVGERELDGEWDYVWVKKPITEPVYEYKCPKSLMKVCE